jgi:hypothetical protein
MSSTTPTSSGDLPLGTAPEHSRLHNRIRRVCYVLLFALVVEGALTFPLLALWYGFPELSPNEVCDELQKVMYADEARECRQPVPLGNAPFGGPAEAEGQTTSEDDWGIQPKPGYPTVRFRDLVDNKEQREARARDDEDENEDDVDTDDTADTADGRPATVP